MAAAIVLAITSSQAAPVLAPRSGDLAFPGASRSYALTPSADHARESFAAEITVTVNSGNGGGGCAFFGLGAGKPSAANFQEPTTSPALVFRFAPSDFAGGRMVASVNGTAVGDPIPLGDGSHRARLVWDAAAKRAWLEIHPRWTPGAEFKPEQTLFLPTVQADFGSSGNLFAGGANGARFADFRIRGITAAEIAKLPTPDAFPDDPSARSWLPSKKSSDIWKIPGLSNRLDPLSASLRPLVCWYAGSSLQASRSLPDGKLTLPGSQWSATMDRRQAPGQPDAIDLTLSFDLTLGAAPASGAAVAFDFTSWNPDSYVLVPGSIYHGNRLRTVNRGYNAGLDQADYYRKDLPLTQGDQPRLEIEPGKPSKFEVNTSNTTTPAICVFDPRAKQGLIILAEQAGRAANGDFLRKPNGEVLDNAFAVEESADRSRAALVISAPGVRERKPEFVGFSGSPDRGIAMKAGDRITVRLRIYQFPAADIPALLEKFMAVRKSLTGPNRPRKLVPASQVEKYMSNVIDSRFLTGKNGSFYCPENGDWIAFGWIGGWIDTFPMLALGDDIHLKRVSDTFDFGFKAQEPSGYFRYAIRQDGNVTFREPKPDMNQSRTMGDTLYWMIKQFDLLKAQGRGGAIKPEWETGMRKLADAFVATWRRDGQWGKMIDVKTGRVSEYNTTGGAPVIQGLAYAAAYFDNPDYLRVAQQAAELYYQRDFVKQGFTTGGCADILQNADSETAAALMASLMALYETTRDKAWLEKSRQVAHLVATWTVSHDYELPKFTELGGLGAKLAGVVWASTQNKHGAPGICTNSGDPLFKLYRATGDTRYAELMRDIIAAHGESIRPDGRTNERLTYCDADSRGSRGGHVTGWNETNGILMAQEIPGIYLRTDAENIYIFDAVEATVVSRAGGTVHLLLRNPTRFDAKVSILAETAAQAAKPLGHTALIHWPRVSVKAGGETRVSIQSDGSVRSD
ncbi:MAG: hypothetical protein J0M04_19665 [Verrucomicrobia bacterium]|nr:hypothetical protein [Verrucomicrobiota bacterium]